MTKQEVIASLEAADDLGVGLAIQVMTACGLAENDAVWWRVLRLLECGASLDAAVALCERMLPGVFYHFTKGRCSGDEPLYAFQLLFGSDEVIAEAEHDCREVAICIALLRALEGGNDG